MINQLCSLIDTWNIFIFFLHKLTCLLGVDV
uniref:Uncharacterized protein n=1 Tax=Arundo donax TaxID=35708 RepID=A0A0A8ZS58_ARUDO